jgi:Phospholipase/Carboxylesterase
LPAMLGAALLLALAAAAGADAVDLRYDLRPGDRLVYRQTLRREGHGADFDYETRAEWRSQVLVTGTRGGRSVLGFQRNRVSFDLVRYREKGHDRTALQRDAFLKRLAPAAFAEANRIGERGVPDLPWSALRESAGELLPGLHEIEPLPDQSVDLGTTWPGGGLLGLELRAAAWEDVGPSRCLRIDGTRPPSDAKLRLWFGLDSGVVERLEFEGAYATVGGRIREFFATERVERHRAEDPLGWAADPETRRGALAAFLVSDPLPVEANRIHRLLTVDDAPFQRQLLAYCLRQRLPPPPAEILGPLLASEDPRLRELASKVAAGSQEGSAAPRAPFTEEPLGATLRPMTTAGLEGWPYALYVPEDYRGDEPLPLLISLSGGPGRALLGLPGAREEIERHGWLVLFPHAADVWWTPKSTHIVSALLDEVLRAFNVDVNRVYLSGSSNGGTGTFLYATLWPHRLAAAVSLMGAGIFVEGDAPLPANLNGLPLLLAHGDKDEVIPMGASRDTLAAVRREAKRSKAEMKVLPGHGHDIFLGGDDGLVAGFVAGRVRDPFPRRVSLALHDLTFPRRYWIEVLAKDGGVATVEGEMGDDNRVRLETRNVRRLRLLLRREVVLGAGPVRVTWNGKEVFSGAFVADPDLLARTGRQMADAFLGWSMDVSLGE